MEGRQGAQPRHRRSPQGFAGEFFSGSDGAVGADFWYTYLILTFGRAWAKVAR